MPDNELSFEGFVNDVNPLYHDFVRQVNDYLMQGGCVVEFKTAKNGYIVSYSYGKPKRVILNFVFRKSGLVIRIYGDYVNQYLDIMEALPGKMLGAIDKAPNCKRLFDPLTCNQRCPMGYSFIVHGNEYRKCRYSCFMFEVNDESIPFISEILERELKERAA